MGLSQFGHRVRAFSALVAAGVVAVAMVPRVGGFASGFFRSSDCGNWGTTASGHSGLWVMNPDGSAGRQLVSGGGSGIAAWAPDGSRLAFVDQTASAQATRIVVVRLDGTDEHDIAIPAEQPAGAIATPAPGPISALGWTPDGSHLVFAVIRNEGVAAIYQVQPDGSELRLQTRLTNFQGWSPDLTRIATVTTEYTPLPEGLPVQTLYNTRLDGSDSVLLAKGPGRITDPIWSPDGKQVAFSADATLDNSPGSNLEVVNSDGTGQRTVAHSDSEFLARAQWSPDSRWLAFDKYPHEDWGWLGVVRSNGTQRHNITGELGKPVTHDAAWSPDGTKIAYVNEHGLATVDRSGDHTTCLHGTAPAVKPVWSPDGRHIAFLGYDAN
jgi:Tol biopolymer transport system component